MQRSPEYPRFAHVSALTYQMIYDGPTYNELPKFSVPVLLAIGQLDRRSLAAALRRPRR